jgi:succinoglycan biosynthesis protein ExoA
MRSQVEARTVPASVPRWSEAERGPGDGWPGVLVIVPVKPGSLPSRALESLSGLEYPRDSLEIVVSAGRAPARQRNEALRAFRGEYILFLDDDSVPEPGLLRRYVRMLEASGHCAAVGGPAVLALDGGSAGGSPASLLMSELAVVGRTASRYRARGALRETDERELILANLCIRREALAPPSVFDERLYPNEENELLERLRLAGWKLLYDPGARVERAAWRSALELLASVHRYGRGRAAQLCSLASRVSIGRVAGALGALACFPLGIWGAFVWPAWALLAGVLYIAYLALVAARLSSRAGLRDGLRASLCVPLLHGAYALGVLRGLASPTSRCRSQEGGEEPISLFRAVPGAPSSPALSISVSTSFPERR